MRTNLIVGALVAILLSASVVHAQSPQYCNSLFEQGKDADRVANKVSQTWLKSQKRYFDSLARVEREIVELAGKPETPELFDSVRVKLQGLRDTLEVIIDDAQPVQEAVDEVRSLLGDLDAECGIHPSIEDWYDAKVDILDKLSDKVSKSASVLGSHATQLATAEANPAKVLRRAMTLPNESPD